MYIVIKKIMLLSLIWLNNFKEKILVNSRNKMLNSTKDITKSDYWITILK